MKLQVSASALAIFAGAQASHARAAPQPPPAAPKDATTVSDVIVTGTRVSGLRTPTVPPPSWSSAAKRSRRPASRTCWTP